MAYQQRTPPKVALTLNVAWWQSLRTGKSGKKSDSTRLTGQAVLQLRNGSCSVVWLHLPQSRHVVRPQWTGGLSHHMGQTATNQPFDGRYQSRTSSFGMQVLLRNLMHFAFAYCNIPEILSIYILRQRFLIVHSVAIVWKRNQRMLWQMCPGYWLDVGADVTQKNDVMFS